MGEVKVEALLTHVVLRDNIVASMQNLAFSALLSLSREILGIELENVAALRSKHPKRVPDVLAKHEVKELLWSLSDQNWLVASVLYGASLPFF